MSLDNIVRMVWNDESKDTWNWVIPYQFLDSALEQLTERVVVIVPSIPLLWSALSICFASLMFALPMSIRTWDIQMVANVLDSLILMIC